MPRSPPPTRPPRTRPPRSGGSTPTSRATYRAGASTRRLASTSAGRSKKRSQDSAKTTRTSPPRGTTSRSSTASSGDGTKPSGCTRTPRGRWRNTTGPGTPPPRQPRTTSGDANSRGVTTRGRIKRTRPPPRRRRRRSVFNTRTTRRRCSTWRRRSARVEITRRARCCWRGALGSSTNAGRGDSSQSLRRMERLAQVRGELLGDHVTAERLRSKVLEARIRISRAHGDHTQGKRGTVRDLASSQRRAAVAAAHEARAKSLESAGRRTDAIGDLRAAVHIHEARVSDAMGLGIPRELLDADDIRPSGVVRGFIELIEQALNPIFGWARPGAAAEAAAANMRLQLASCRLKLADVLVGTEEGRRTVWKEEDGKRRGRSCDARWLRSSRWRWTPPPLCPSRLGPTETVLPLVTMGTGPSGLRFAGVRRRKLPSVTSRRSCCSLEPLVRSSRRSPSTMNPFVSHPRMMRRGIHTDTWATRSSGCTRRTARRFWPRVRRGRFKGNFASASGARRTWGGAVGCLLFKSLMKLES